jgi:hypothetical protein
MKSIFTLFLITVGIFSYAQTFTETDRLISSDRGERDRFGQDVAIDGNYAVVGAYGEGNGISLNRGAVYVYEYTGGNWVEIQKLEASDQENYDRFGWSVAIDGDYIVVGANGEDEDENQTNDMSKAGSAYIFKNNNGTWTEIQKIVASDRSADDEFGWSVDISDSTIIIGAHQDFEDENGLFPIHHAGSAYIFELNTSSIWVETQKIAGSGRRADINYPNGYSGEDLSDQFGHYVSVSGDYIVVGSLHSDFDINNANSRWAAGLVYVFEKNNLGVWEEVQILQNPEERKAFDRFGSAVSIDTNFIAVGVYAEDESVTNTDVMMNSGSVYIFERDGSGVWNYSQKLVAQVRNSGDHFGYDVQLDGDYLITGLRQDNDDANELNELEDAGSAYIFKKDGTSQYSVVQKISASDRDSLDVFGYAVDISNVNVIVGAFQHDYNLTDTDSLDQAGKVYVFSGCTTPINYSQTIEICDGESLTVGTSVYSSTGNYNDVLVTSYGCDSIVTTNLTIKPEMLVNQTITLCDGETLTVGTSTYTTAGNYTDVLETVDGCDSTVNSFVTENTAFEISQNITICYGEVYNIGTSTYSNPGNYTDILPMTNSSCDSIIHTNLSVNLPLDLSVDANGNNLESNQYDAFYQWINCSNGSFINSTASNNQDIDVAETGNYGVIINQNGCIDTSACVYVNYVGIDEVSSNDFSVYPNPNSGVFYADITKIDDSFTLEIYNQIGQRLFKKINYKSQEKIDLTYLPKGIYFVQLKSDNSNTIQKIIIE